MFRRTKLVATVGPQSSDQQVLKGLLDAGVDVVRLNCSHAGHQEIAALIARIRELEASLGRAVGILLDLSGPKLRTGSLKGGMPVRLETGREFTLTSLDIEGNSSIVSTNYPQLVQEARAGDTILLDDGLIELAVLSADATDLRCSIVSGGILKNHKGINIPGAKLSIPSLTEKDKQDLTLGLAHDVDFIALSFVRDAADIVRVKELTASSWPPPLVIAKLEKPEALDHLEEILEVADGVMIARGDLGVELPPEKVPPAQKRIIRLSNLKGKPVITATQMLESMIEHPRPTRAEASDVANAIYDGTDAVMLSGETAVGKYPLEAVRMMDRIARAAEETQDYTKLKEHKAPTSAQAIAHAACAMAVDMQARAIAAFTKSGATARLISQFRPPGPIIALTQHLHVFRQLSVNWGVSPFMLMEVSDSEATLALVEEKLLDSGIVSHGDSLVITGGLPIAARGAANFVKLSRLPESAPRQHLELKGI